MTHHFIITIHNSEQIIGDVLDAVAIASRRGGVIVPVLDGCSDGSSRVVERFAKKHGGRVRPVVTPDLHEIGAINAGLNVAPPGGVFVLQDDVILTAEGIEDILERRVLNKFPNAGYVSFRLGGMLMRTSRWKAALQRLRHRGSVTGRLIGVCDFVRSPFDELSPFARSAIGQQEVREIQVGIKSPVWISEQLRIVRPFLDENLRPYCYDDVDLSIEALRLGLRNFLCSVPYISKKEWGGTRNAKSSFARESGRIALRNRGYLARKHGPWLAKQPMLKKDGVFGVS